MNLRRIQAVMRRHLYESLRNWDRISDVLFWPFLDVITWGFFSRYLIRGGSTGFAAPLELIGGITLWGAFRSFQRDIAVGFLAEIWSRNMVGVFASPITLGEYLIALLTINLLKLSLALGLIALGAYALTGLPDLALFVRLLAPLALLLVFGAAVGLFATGLILSYSTRIQTVAYGLAGLLMPVSCVFYPLDALPGPLRSIANALPTTQAFEAMRSYMEMRGGETAPLVRGMIVATTLLLMVSYYFHHVVRTARRTGRLIRLD
jgi:ABC-2 type transport system permease protein